MEPTVEEEPKQPLTKQPDPVARQPAKDLTNPYLDLPAELLLAWLEGGDLARR